MAGRKPATAEGIASQTGAIRIVWGRFADPSLSVTGTHREQETVPPDDGTASLEEGKAVTSFAASASPPRRRERTELGPVMDEFGRPPAAQDALNQEARESRTTI